MNRKQRKRISRIVISLVLFILLLILEKAGILEGINGFVLFAIYFIPYIIVGYDVIVRAAKNISHGQIFDENFLMMIATFAAFGLGLLGDNQYEEALAVMLFYQIGEAFQDYAVGKSRQSITDMMNIAPEYANLEQDGEVEQVDPDDVHIGDIIVIRAGEKVPLDGKVIEGVSFLDTAALTGESVPRRICVGDEVISGCVNGEGTLRINVTKEYEDSTVAKILDLVENATSKKARLENFITRFAKYYTPVVTIGAVILAVMLPLFFGLGIADGIRRACNFLIVSCPCALVISVPLGFFGGIGAASKIGVLVKGSNFLEAASRVDTIVMDKTGTLTKGEFKVQSIITDNGFEEEKVLELAAYGEFNSNHPIAQSIMNAYKNDDSDSTKENHENEKSLDMEKINPADTKEIAGFGVETILDGKKLLVGNAKLLKKENISFKENNTVGTIVYVAYDSVYAGCIVIADSVKDGAKDAISSMKRTGITKTVMLTGDREETAIDVSSKLGIDEVRSNLLPADKAGIVEEFLNKKKHSSDNNMIAFVGDGINDAPVLAIADVGIAMGAMGSDAAVEAADIVLMDDDIRKIPTILKIARKTMKIVRANVIFAIAVKVFILILSAVGLASMWAAVFGDVGVSVICILNSMRALSVKEDFSKNTY